MKTLSGLVFCLVVVVWLGFPLIGLTLTRRPLAAMCFPLPGGRRRSWALRKVMKAWGRALSRRRALLSTGMLVIPPQSAHHLPQPKFSKAPPPPPHQASQQHKGHRPHHHHRKKRVSSSISIPKIHPFICYSLIIIPSPQIIHTNCISGTNQRPEEAGSGDRGRLRQ